MSLGSSGRTRVTFVGAVPPLSGGIAQHSARVVETLAACGADVRVISWASQYPRALYKGSGFDPSSTAMADARYVLRWWDPASWVTAGFEVHKGDLLVMPWVTPAHAIPERVISAVGRVPFSLVVHNVIPHERMPFDRRLAGWMMRRAEHIVVHADAVADAVRTVAPSVPITVVPMPPLLPIESSTLPPSPPLRLLCLGIIREYKGFDIALDALVLLRNRGVDVQLTIAGEVWNDTSAWDERVRDPALDGALTLIGRYLTDGEIAELVSTHHILVAPYRSATQSGVVPLAFAGGRPVVATDVGGLREAIHEGHNGLLVPPEDPESLADAVERMALDLAAFAQRAGASRHSWEPVASALLTPTRSRSERAT